jgi:hypothetical protein
MSLIDLVPPLELCKKIPAGELKDSCFVRAKTFEGWVILLRDCVEKNKAYMAGFAIYPAPTLQEILAVLPPYGKNEQILACCVPDWADFDARVFGENWRVGYTGDCSINDKNPATAALKLWLKLKGIDYEN